MDEKALKQITESIIEPIINDFNDFSDTVIKIQVLGQMLNSISMTEDIDRNVSDYLKKSAKTIEEIVDNLELTQVKQTIAIEKVRNRLDSLLPSIVDMAVKQTLEGIKKQK